MRQNKRLGTSYECLFLYEALQRGLHPHQCVGDYLGHDIAIMNDAGKFFRVNVKGTSQSRCSNGGARRFTIKVLAGSPPTPLDCTKVDVVAVYIAPKQLWYLVPCLPVSNLSTLKFYPDTPNGSKAVTETYRENWDCFLS